MTQELLDTFGRRVRKLSTSSQDSVASVGSYAGEIIQSIRTVQGFNREAAETMAFDGEVEKAFAIARSRIRQRALGHSLNCLTRFESFPLTDPASRLLVGSLLAQAGQQTRQRGEPPQLDRLLFES